MANQTSLVKVTSSVLKVRLTDSVGGWTRTNSSLLTKGLYLNDLLTVGNVIVGGQSERYIHKDDALKAVRFKTLL